MSWHVVIARALSEIAQEELAAARAKYSAAESRYCEGKGPRGWALAAMRSARIAYQLAERRAFEARERFEKAGAQA